MNLRKCNNVPNIFVPLLLEWIWSMGQTPRCAGRTEEQVAAPKLSHLILPTSSATVGWAVLGQMFFPDSSYSCLSKCCPDTGIQSLSRVMKHLQWQLQLLPSPLQSFCGQIQNLMVPSGSKIHLEQSFWSPFLWKESNVYMQTEL